MPGVHSSLQGNMVIALRNHKRIILPFDIVDLICDNLQGKDLINYAATCQSMRTAVRLHIRHKCSFSKYVHPFFPVNSRDSIRQAMIDYDMIISGSVALAFFTRQPPPSTNIDLLLPCSNLGQALKWFRHHFSQKGHLMESVPHTKRPNEDENGVVYAMRLDIQPNFHDFSIAKVITFVFNGLNVNLVACVVSPAETVARFQCTIMMVTITAYAAYCWYPLPTLNLKLGMINERRNMDSIDILQKYVLRGYRMIRGLRRPSERKRPSSLFNEYRRFVGDIKTWTIPLNVDNESYKKDPFQLNSWELWFNKDLGWKGEMSYSLISSPFLKSTIIVADDIAVDHIKTTLLALPVVEEYIDDNPESFFCDDSSACSSEKSSTSEQTNNDSTISSTFSDIDESLASMYAPLKIIPVNTFVDNELVEAIMSQFTSHFPKTNV
ncbi:hypothetical protein BJ165DRAFT_1520500 [Panaeolus papilionaceus]|nr:hypothetical protein BJ165DRAFT_1520500 [Panaeolus papilionaceus]